jgi:hypothetical protein
MSSASGTALVYLGRTSISGMSASNSRITSAIAGLASQNYPRIANADTSAMAVWVQNVSGSKNVAYSFAGNISSGFATYSNIPGTTSSGLMNADIAMTPGAVHVVWEDDNSGKVMYIKGTYPLPSKVASLGNSEKIEIYPNPASTSFRVDLPKGVNINSGYLTDELGKTIALKANTTNGNASFSLNGIARGNYTFIMETVEGKTFHSKLLVQ